MKTSMSSQSFTVLIVTALLCHCITPTFSTVSITQEPPKAKTGEKVILKVGGIPPRPAACAWFRGDNVDEPKLVSSFTETPANNKEMANGITIDETSCALTINSLSEKDITLFSFLALYKDKVERGKIVVNGAQRFGLSSIVLLAVAGLVSSFTLL